jgi:hypothetical protein
MRESLGTYDYKLVENDDKVVKYEFLDDSNPQNRFLVMFKNDYTTGPGSRIILGKSYEITYFVYDVETGDWSVDKVVPTNVWVIMRTIFGKILTEFLHGRYWVSKIRLEGQAKPGEKGETQRTKLYKRHLGNNPVDGFRVVLSDTNRIDLIKKI